MSGKSVFENKFPEFSLNEKYSNTSQPNQLVSSLAWQPSRRSHIGLDARTADARFCFLCAFVPLW
jgi:hypothetical protein